MEHPLITLPQAMAPAPSLSELEFCRRVGTAGAGDRVAYHLGFLAVDRAAEASRLPAGEQRELNRVASRAWLLADAEYGTLFQRRLAPGLWEYIFVRSAKLITVHDVHHVLRLPLKAVS